MISARNTIRVDMMENMHIVPKNHDVELAVGFTSRYSVLFLFLPHSLYFYFYFILNGGH